MNYNKQLLQSLYSNASGKYLKFKHRFDKAVQSGRFYTLNKRKQSSLISRLKKLFERLKSLQAQLRLAGVGAALALTISLSNPLKAQNATGPFVRNDVTNPFVPPLLIARPRPAVVDIDNDGDLDVFVGNASGNIQFFRNDSPTGTVTRFTEFTLDENPLSTVYKGLNAAPTFGDVDGDGDFDMVLGVDNPSYDDPAKPGLYNNSSKTFFFENTGTRTNAIFTERTGASNPFNGIYGPKYGPAIPTLAYFDGDADIDLYVGGSSYTDYSGTPHRGGQFFQNQGTVTSPVFTSYYIGLTYYLTFGKADVTFADLDNDGDMDAFVGSNNNYLRVFSQDVENTFDRLTGPPNPFNGFYFGNYTSPVVADFDKDGDLDFIVASEENGNFYGPDETNLVYIENTGNFNLELKPGLNISPFDGVDVGEKATPVFADLDGDNDLDAVIGSKYSEPDMFVYTNVNGKYESDPDHQIVNILDGLGGFNGSLIPVFADIDHDGDQDLFICRNYDIKFFRKTGANFVAEPTPFPTITYANSRYISLAFVDFDNDGDLDAFMGNFRSGQPDVIFFVNIGTATVPNFSRDAPPGPFSTPNLFQHEVNLSAVDLDNDGDTDLVATETYYNGWYGDSYASRIRFFANDGEGEFVEASSPIIEELTPRSFTSFVDFDGDGDLDAFSGSGYTFDYNQNGRVFYFENTNPPPTSTLDASIGDALGGEGAVVDPALTITDADGDFIVKALVSIQNFQVGNEELTFTPFEEIAGSFDETTGILTLSGKAPIDSYQAILRTVAHNFTGTVPGGRKSESGKVQSINRTISFQVFDEDFTTPAISSRTIHVAAPNTAPIITPQTIQANQGSTVTVNVLTSITDADGNFIPASSTLTIVQQPASGAVATLNFVSASVVQLIVNYTGLTFSGTEQVQIQACDELGACSTSAISVQVAPNVAPVIVPAPINATAGSAVTINVLPIITDADGNFIPSSATVTIVQQPVSGAAATLDFVSGSVVNLVVDYAGISFTGNDQLQIQACDDLGACTISTINIQVGVAAEIIIYNAFSPNSDDNINSFFNIKYIETVSPENKVTIYNRWGDAVFEIANYNNTTRKFEGISDKGKDLPSGTYFYKIVITGKELTGYLSLKR